MLLHISCQMSADVNTEAWTWNKWKGTKLWFLSFANPHPYVHFEMFNIRNLVSRISQVCTVGMRYSAYRWALFCWLHHLKGLFILSIASGQRWRSQRNTNKQKSNCITGEQCFCWWSSSWRSRGLPLSYMYGCFPVCRQSSVPLWEWTLGTWSQLPLPSLQSQAWQCNRVRASLFNSSLCFKSHRGPRCPHTKNQ